MNNKDKQCANCKWWEQDYGIWTVTGWTGMWRDDGDCRIEPHRIYKKGKNCCRNWEAVDRWNRQMNTEYKDLPEAEKKQ